MPIARVEMYEGRTEDQKAEMVRRVTEVLAEVLRVRPDEVHVVIYEVPRQNWGIGGRLGSRRD